jgi:diphthine synthase
MFYLVGLGLGCEKDITVAGLEIVRKCALVLLESYTAVLPSVSECVCVCVCVSA